MDHRPQVPKTPQERAATKAKADLWRERCLTYRAAEAAAGLPVIPSERVMEERIDRLWSSANPTPGFSPRVIDQHAAKINAKRGGGL